ncbi:heavy-metal-associated domain-containing protein [Butyrivibrio proteoclasticus]|uniref:heavy-metal-associated domain-containing protein n=1 Tax=Butyrivibrio proteoclasticus TaxID=43305 RepID=UPI00055415F7|nr:heavy metal-associated domain-containing protein [Butyrivibrio proteoclasticus]
MYTTTIIAAVVLLAALSLLIFMMRRKLTHGSSCCGTHEASERKIKVADKKISNYSYHYEVKIGQMVCSNCATRVENAFNKNDGIYAKVDLENKRAIVHAKRELSRNDVAQFMNGLPYVIKDFNDIKL